MLLLFGPVTFCECCITFADWNQLLWDESVQIFAVALRNGYWVGWKDMRISTKSKAVIKKKHFLKFYWDDILQFNGHFLFEREGTARIYLSALI